MRKLSNGAPVMPRQLAHHASSSASQSAAIPPPRHRCGRSLFRGRVNHEIGPEFVGRCNAGDKNVLSTQTMAPDSRPAATIVDRSVMRSNGLLGVSIQRSFGLRSRTVLAAVAQVRSTKETSKWPRPASERSMR